MDEFNPHVYVMCPNLCGGCLLFVERNVDALMDHSQEILGWILEGSEIQQRANPDPNIVLGCQCDRNYDRIFEEELAAAQRGEYDDKLTGQRRNNAGLGADWQ